ncbi:fructosamine kinase [Pokkaliibacter plantistimulans]|uniref:Fructosamine kinase n=1 Tax=Proteobacteria bacterium 228 TaxID=2083153 RepID=A0A2S5KPA1_9PROT|nr:fructosamine kinase family protein [Pokkaliibacter plantistimulans]PPC76608.1 fructosamine kinase [Pokkaliibacter plantistimulans]
MPHFVKHRRRGSKALICEAQGLALLRDTLQASGNQLLQIPEVYAVSEVRMELQLIEQAPQQGALMAQLGQGLARLHQLPMERYGLGYDNYIGLAPQANGWYQDWGRFFVERRLQRQIAAIEDQAIRRRFDGELQHYQHRLIDFLHQHCTQPSLVHGDLWSGNVLFGHDQVWLIDPAVHHADREVDLAMTELFGGFSTEFYQAYDAVFPRSAVYDLKRPLYNLYHYLNHFNLFGPSYLPGCERGLAALASL